ncbi:RebB family R body protein [Roseofilum sp. Guam]|uniref:RebB family R body protein n=1 Tax=Roseofilum sp. Guam TaxID=2821502 RepID=UPI001B22A3A2|nr:RebB family R body protein [Roseofilum sp. Guam]MBP0030916.1 RebB family R body protein [Roseofilum sp. Guam]
MSDSSIPDDIQESIAISNAKSVAEQPAMLANLAFANLVANTNLSQQNAVSNQQAMNQLAMSITAKVINKISDLNSVEAVGVKQLDTGNDESQK